MYLYVFVFIILAIMSIYTELFSLNVARINEQQTAVAGVMFAAHNGAYKFTKNNYDATKSDVVAVNGICVVSIVNPLGVQALRCKDNANLDLTFNMVSEGLAAAKVQYVPDGFNIGTIGAQYPSYVHKDGTTRFIVTYVLGGINALGLDANQTITQMNRAKFPNVSYGTVFAGNCVAHNPAIGNRIEIKTFRDWGGVDVDLCYNLPSAVPVGSVGILSHL